MKESEQEDYVEYINKLIKEHVIVIFTKDNSYACLRAKIHIAHYKPYEVNLDDDPIKGHLILNALKLITKQTNLPNIFVNGEHIGGCSNLESFLDSSKFRHIILMSIFKDEFN